MSMTISKILMSPSNKSPNLGVVLGTYYKDHLRLICKHQLTGIYTLNMFITFADGKILMNIFKDTMKFQKSWNKLSKL